MGTGRGAVFLSQVIANLKEGSLDMDNEVERLKCLDVLITLWS